MNAAVEKLSALRDVIDKLLSPEGCPWDREQSPESLCEYVIEESHELAAAIRRGESAAVADEMGDVLFLLLFISALYEEKGEFALSGVLEGSRLKMIRRHPHVFSAASFGSREELLAAWEAIKRSEKAGEHEKPVGVFAGLPESLPPLLKAYRIHSRAAGAGFTWESDSDVEQQVEAEWLELLDAFASEDKAAQERELGDIIFTLVELGRRKGIKAGAALDASARRFLRRFSFMERAAGKDGKEFATLCMEEKNALWDMAKRDEKKGEGR
ncbi:MAG: nucleoside triphosphate pyrophosphohydrolase [Desulfovibrio sp.]|nr:nucleoside triphosphate pyrophosphohydrolase [Desulfovibrio sp.]